MPFTVTHIAAVIPVKKLTGQWLPFSALAIGSVVPDMPVFFESISSYSQTHSLTGIFTTCLPIGIVLYLLFQLVGRTALLELMPNSISLRLGERRAHTPIYIACVLLALVIGASTHVLWDSFTHFRGWGVEHYPQLKHQFMLFGRWYGAYKLFQHGSSVVLLPLMAYLLYRWSRAPFEPPARPFHSRLNLPLWIKLTGCFVIFVGPALWACAEAWMSTNSFYYGIGRAARAYGRYLVITGVSGSVLIHLLIWKRRTSALQTL